MLKFFSWEGVNDGGLAVRVKSHAGGVTRRGPME